MQELFKEDESPKKPLITRRGFLRGAGAATVITAAGFGGPSTRDVFEETFESGKLKEEIKSKILLIELKYGIIINGTILDSQNLKEINKEINKKMGAEYKEVSMVKIDRALDYLIQEFAKYPTFFVKSLEIPSINIVDSLVEGGNETTTGTTSTKAAGLENLITLEISKGFLDKGKKFGWSEKEPFNETLHHELFHAVFNFVDESSRHEFSEAWVSLYGLADFDTPLHEGRAGYISEYAQTGSNEDFAETASAMVNNGKGIFEKIEKDEELKKKVEFLKRLMFQKSFGLCNQEYWDSVKSGNFSKDFFIKRKTYLLSLNPEQFHKELELNNWSETEYFAFGQEGLLEKEFPGKVFKDIREGMFQLFRKSLTEVEIC